MELPMDPESSDESLSPLSTPAIQTGFTWRRALIVPILIGYYVSLGILLFCVPQYTQQVFKEKYNITSSSKKNEGCSSKNGSQNTDDLYDKVQQEVATWSIYYAVASLAPAVFMNLIWGSYSDVLGRRFQFTFCSAGALIRIVAFALVVQYKLDLGFIVASNVIEALSGGFASMLAVMFAFGADITDTGKQRMAVIVIFEVIIGFVIGAVSFASGYLIESAGYFLPALVSSFLSLFGVIVSGFFLPETLHADSKNKNKDRSILKILSSSYKTFCRNDTRTKNAKYMLLLLAFTLFAIPSISRGSLEVLYQIGEPFCWTAKQVGYFGAIKMSVGMVVSLISMYVLQKCLANDSIAIFGVVMGIGSFILEGFADTDAQLYTVNAFAAFTMLPTPMMRSLLSSMTPADSQGAMFATIGIVETIATLVGSLTNNIVYSATLSIMNGFAFLLSGIITFLALVALIVYKVLRHCSPEVDFLRYETLIQEQI